MGLSWRPQTSKAVVSNVAGSVALFPACFRRFVRVTGWPLHEAIKAAGYNQLRSLGIADRGEIAAGQIADSFSSTNRCRRV